MNPANTSTPAADATADQAHTVSAGAGLVLPEIPKEVTFNLGGKPYTVAALPWGRCKKVVACLARVGAAMAAGRGHEEQTHNDVIQALTVALNMPVEELEQLPVEPIEVTTAVNELIRVTGMERFQMAEFARLRELAKQFTETPQALRTLAEVIAMQGEAG